MSSRTRHTRRFRRDWRPAVEPAAIPEEFVLVGDKYRVIGRLGEGAFGVVLRGRDEQLERDVAIKLIRRGFSREPEFQNTFLQEARAMARVNHPNVVKIFDFGWHRGTPYFVMEFIEGVDLDSWVERRGDVLLSVDEALGLMNQICRGVSGIHEAGTLHRDLKPNNVLVAGNLRVFVADLGLARVVELTDDDLSMGTPGFIAPEVILKHTITPEQAPSIDVYALGAMAYELLTGVPAFPGSTHEEILRAQLRKPPAPPSELRPELGEAFDAVIAAALHVDPNVRIGTSEGFRRGLLEARVRATDSSAGRRIVVAESDPNARRHLERVLSNALPKVSVEVVRNGREALHGVVGRPTSVLIGDLEMPELGGEELLRIIRSDPNFNHLAVIMTTALGGAREWKVLRELGADGFFVKPLDPVPLVALVKSLLDTPMRNRVR